MAATVTWQEKQKEFEQVKARVKALKLRSTCTICGESAKLNCPCASTQYCSVACQKVDWRERGHRAACKKIRDERAAEAARAEAPTPPPSPPPEVFYGPAPRSHADEVRARIAAEHEAARLRREANPEREPASACFGLRYGSSCPICFEPWDVNGESTFLPCCCRLVCDRCWRKTLDSAKSQKVEPFRCPLCLEPYPEGDAQQRAAIRRHVENDIPEAMTYLAGAYHNGWYGLSKSDKKAMKLHKRAAELGNWHAMAQLADLYMEGEGVKLNPKKAKELFRTAADKGVAMAQISLGKLYYDAEPPLYGEAYRYFKMAADQGRTDAEHCVGVCYIYGQGVEKDLDEAERWFTRAAAEKGIGEAEKWYRSKRGTDTSRDVAKVSLAKLAKLREREAVNAKWRPKLQKLAANGDEKAIAALEELERA